MEQTVGFSTAGAQPRCNMQKRPATLQEEEEWGLTMC